jgi:hypothetical protein
MGPTYQSGLDIDRIDNNLDYTPKNCRWTTRKVNANNKRNTVWLDTPQGRMRLSEAALASGLRKTTLLYRKAAEWPAERLFDAPKSTIS